MSQPDNSQTNTGADGHDGPTSPTSRLEVALNPETPHAAEPAPAPGPDLTAPRISLPVEPVNVNGTSTGSEPSPAPSPTGPAEGTRGEVKPTPRPDPTLPKRPVTAGQAAVCLASIMAWIVLAIAGVAITTKPYIDAMGSGTSLGFVGLTKAFFVLTTCYTFTNIAFLCCLSSIIGAVGRSAGIAKDVESDDATDFRTLCIAAIIRGFFVYITIVSGTLMLADQKFDDISIQQYLQLAGLVSLASFAAGYDPMLFGRLFNRVSMVEENLKRPLSGNPPGATRS